MQFLKLSYKMQKILISRTKKVKVTVQSLLFILIFNLKLFSVSTTWDISEHTLYHSVLYSLAGMLCMQVKHVTLSPVSKVRQITKGNKNEHIFYRIMLFFSFFLLSKPELLKLFHYFIFIFHWKASKGPIMFTWAFK